MKKRQRTPGQALVEFALMASLLFFMLAAAVDLGLIFFTIQGLHNAAQEGAAYVYVDGSAVDKKEMRARARFEGGADPKSGFVNLLDLNNNGTNDKDEGILDKYITIEFLFDSNFDGKVPDAPTDTCEESVVASGRSFGCYTRVTVYADYHALFPLAPALAETIPLRSEFITVVRTEPSYTPMDP